MNKLVYLQLRLGLCALQELLCAITKLTELITGVECFYIILKYMTYILISLHHDKMQLRTPSVAVCSSVSICVVHAIIPTHMHTFHMCASKNPIS